MSTDAPVAPVRPERHLWATVAYDGTDFCGFQVQSVQRTVQGALEEALAQITQAETRVVGAGRTDSGVHAVGQVVAFSTRWKGTNAALHRAWNAVLPRDVAVWSLDEVEAGFHPRYDARSRTYRYTIWNNSIRNPLLRRTALWEPRPLDLAAMQEAAGVLVGEHDFATFGAPPQGTNTVRRVLSTGWTREGMRLCLDIAANAFLYRMVRSIVGTLLLVGRGALTVEGFASLLAAKERSQSGPTAPAHGLCLMAVEYEGVP